MPEKGCKEAPDLAGRDVELYLFPIDNMGEHSNRADSLFRVYLARQGFKQVIRACSELAFAADDTEIDSPTLIKSCWKPYRIWAWPLLSNTYAST